MIARIRVILEKSFKFDLQEPDETGFSQSRVEAAQHAETVLANELRNKLGDSVIEIMVEEVRDA